MPNRPIVVTTINAPTKGMLELSRGAGRTAQRFFVCGDLKSPPTFELANSTYLSVPAQVEAFPEFCSVLPTKHYTRKNVGYLLAMRHGADMIQETDDDNIPRDPFWEPSPERLSVRVAGGKTPWLNVYRLFSDQHIWPRGLPLEYLRAADQYETQPPRESRCLILQGLADENPDVDAVYRLVPACPLPIDFEKRDPVLLAAGTWCPFNSQNTVFKREAFPLLYLPSKCSFRMTDIWRSFVAQRCLWELGEGVVFHPATVYQERNEHNLLRDFEDEIPGYLLNDKIRKALEGASLDRDVTRSLVRCYEVMVEAKLLPAEEMLILRAWVKELERLKVA